MKRKEQTRNSFSGNNQIVQCKICFHLQHTLLTLNVSQFFLCSFCPTGKHVDTFFGNRVKMFLLNLCDSHISQFGKHAFRVRHPFMMMILKFKDLYICCFLSSVRFLFPPKNNMCFFWFVCSHVSLSLSLSSRSNTIRLCVEFRTHVIC